MNRAVAYIIEELTLPGFTQSSCALKNMNIRVDPVSSRRFFDTLSLVTDTVSKSQIDKLGERLRSDQDSDEDLVMLDAYRRSFSGAYEATTHVIHNVLKLATSGRPSKSTQSIRDKLVRESIRLSQIQDIAGCRIVVLNTEHQEEVLSLLSGAAQHHL